MSGDSWATPQWLFDYCNVKYGPFDIDVAASQDNHKCEKFYTEKDNGLDINNSWSCKFWCNPPYSDPLPWVKRAAYQNGVMLLPADTSTVWFSFVFQDANEIVFINHRIKFEGATGSPKFGSILAVYDRDNKIRGVTKCSLVDLRRYIR